MALDYGRQLTLLIYTNFGEKKKTRQKLHKGPVCYVELNITAAVKPLTSYLANNQRRSKYAGPCLRKQGETPK